MVELLIMDEDDMDIEPEDDMDMDPLDEAADEPEAVAAPVRAEVVMVTPTAEQLWAPNATPA